MGNGIAHVFAQKGFKVNLIDTQSTALDKAISKQFKKFRQTIN